MENIKDHEWVAKTVYYKKKGDKVVCMAVSPVFKFYCANNARLPLGWTTILVQKCFVN